MRPSARHTKGLTVALLLASFAGFLDAVYLTAEHYLGRVPPCTILNGCERVTTSVYSTVAGIPLALLGALYYLAVFILALIVLDTGRLVFVRWIVALTTFGFLVSLGLVYLQLFVLHALCIYCLFSVLTTTIAFAVSLALPRRESPSPPLPADR